ncbi:type II secretion system protein N [Thiothrix fructosivorans]|uniref:Type II secretion system protein N n=1 Tax=Thiothrix fructosivorans TaxID=111770 RepID=A0A8B0SHP3_9GAMM|nr:type II secretion system protein N [Thiothrix fructosivorans]MBO0612872.1 type II secretion system protein N [Thiothrix fructosivorans]QTX11673.1 type II secretion system protein N [Thiothrix fructosivorans]
MKKRTLILAGTASFLLASLTQLPARLLVSQLPADLPVQLQGVNGTLWSGGVATLSAQGMQIHNLHWDVQASALLSGQLAVDLRGNFAQGGQFDGICSINLSQTLHCAPLNLSDFPAKALAPYLQRLMIPPLSGTFLANFSEVTWDQVAFPQLSGQGEWREAGVQMLPQRYGTYTASVSEGNGVQQVTLASAPDAAFTLDGTVTLQANGQYESALNLKPSSGVDEGTKQFLSNFIVPPQSDGTFQIREQGQLPK